MKKSISFLGYLKIPYEQYKSVSFIFDLIQIQEKNRVTRKDMVFIPYTIAERKNVILEFLKYRNQNHFFLQSVKETDFLNTTESRFLRITYKQFNPGEKPIPITTGELFIYQYHLKSIYIRFINGRMNPLVFYPYASIFTQMLDQRIQELIKNCSYYDFMMSLYQSSMENNDRIELNYFNGLKNIFYFTF